jgi:hypothetical protein
MQGPLRRAFAVSGDGEEGYRGNATRGPEHVAGRLVAKTALLGTKLFGPDVSVAKASRWIETLTLVLREGAMSQDELYHALRQWSRATISRDVPSSGAKWHRCGLDALAG